MAAITFLALGTGSLDVFSSFLFLRSRHCHTGFIDILSVGTLVIAFVAGFIAVHVAPFPVDLTCFVRDVRFYLVAHPSSFSFLAAERWRPSSDMKANLSLRLRIRDDLRSYWI